MEKSKPGVIFTENRELRKLLRKGDMVEIATMSGLNVSYVRNVMGGYRNNPIVIACARRVIEDRKQRIEEIVNPNRSTKK